MSLSRTADGFESDSRCRGVGQIEFTPWLALGLIYFLVSEV